MAIDSGLKRSNGSDLGNNLFAGNGTSSGNQTFKIIMKNGVDLGRGWYNKNSCSQAVGAVGFKNSAGVDVGTLLGKYGTLNCNCDCNCDCDCDCWDICDTDTDGCFISGVIVTLRGNVEVSEIKEGDFLLGVDNQWHKVVGVAKNVIGNRKIFSLPNGGCVTEDHIVFLNNESHVPSLSKLHLDFALTATNGKQGKYQIDSVRQIEAPIFLEPVSKAVITYSPITETRCITYLNGDLVLIAQKV